MPVQTRLHSTSADDGVHASCDWILKMTGAPLVGQAVWLTRLSIPDNSRVQARILVFGAMNSIGAQLVPMAHSGRVPEWMTATADLEDPVSLLGLGARSAGRVAQTS